MTSPDPAAPDRDAPGAALVIGASGGIGAVLADALDRANDHSVVHRAGRALPLRCDYDDAASIAALAEHIAAGPPLTTLIVATGLLHDGAHGPEKALRDLDADWLARQYLVNVIGPALVLKQLLPRMPRHRPVTAALFGARVGSISDNRRGGWYGYRSAKAALHQLVRTASIEWTRTHPQSVLVAVHPGTVDTALSAPFQRGLPGGQLQSPGEAAARILTVLGARTPGDSGRIFDHLGTEIAP